MNQYTSNEKKDPSLNSASERAFELLIAQIQSIGSITPEAVQKLKNLFFMQSEINGDKIVEAVFPDYKERGIR